MADQGIGIAPATCPISLIVSIVGAANPWPVVRDWASTSRRRLSRSMAVGFGPSRNRALGHASMSRFLRVGTPKGVVAVCDRFGRVVRSARERDDPAAKLPPSADATSISRRWLSWRGSGPQIRYGDTARNRLIWR